MRIEGVRGRQYLDQRRRSEPLTADADPLSSLPQIGCTEMGAAFDETAGDRPLAEVVELPSLNAADKSPPFLGGVVDVTARPYGRACEDRWSYFLEVVCAMVCRFASAVQPSWAGHCSGRSWRRSSHVSLLDLQSNRPMS